MLVKFIIYLIKQQADIFAHGSVHDEQRNFPILSNIQILYSLLCVFSEAMRTLHEILYTQLLK